MKQTFSFALVMICLLCACGKPVQQPSGLCLYLPAPHSEETFLSEAVSQTEYSGEATVEALSAALLRELFGGEVKLLGWSLSSGLLRLDLSREYETVEGIDLTITECCIVLTLTQLDGVERVRVTAEGRKLLSGGQDALSADHMIFTGAEEEPREVSVELYFPRLGGRGLGLEVHQLILTEEDNLYAAVTQALLAGPQSGDLHAPFPEGTELLDARLEDGVCYVSFSEALLTNGSSAPADQDLLLYSIVDTLGNLDAVSAVQLLIDGTVPKSYGTADTSLPLEPNFGLLARDERETSG